MSTIREQSNGITTLFMDARGVKERKGRRKKKEDEQEKRRKEKKRKDPKSSHGMKIERGSSTTSNMLGLRHN